MGALSSWTVEVVAITEDCDISEMDWDAEVNNVDCVDSCDLASRTGESDRKAFFQMDEKNSKGSGDDFSGSLFPERDATTGVNSRRADGPIRCFAAAADGDMIASDFRRCATE